MSKIFICGIVSSEAPLEEVRRSVSQFTSFDGAVWVVNYPTDDYSNTDVYDILATNKGCGRILKAPWVFNHSLSRNIYLNSGVFKEGDFIFTPDIQEIFQPDFLANIKAIVNDWEKQGIGSIFWGRAYGFRYNDDLQYHQSPHEQLYGLKGKMADIRDEKGVKYHENSVEFSNFLHSYKSFDNSMLLSASRYWLTYAVSNEVLNQFGRYGNDVVREFEIKRRELRRYLQETLNINIFNIKDIIFYLKNTVDYPQKLKDYIEDDDFLKTIFRFFVMNQTRQEILANRYNYSVWGTPNYIGKRNELNLKLGLPQE